MPTTPRIPLFRRVPPGVWTGVFWCVATAYGVRGHLGLPGMPRGSAALALWSWPVIGVATAMALEGSRRLRHRPLVAFGLLVGGSVGVGLAVDSTHVALLHLVAMDIALGVLVATRRWPVRVTAFALAIAITPAYGAARWLLGRPDEFGSSTVQTGSWTGWLMFILTAAVAGLIGNSIRQSRDYARRLSEHAAAEAVTVERLRISRELHDLVAHNMGIIALQAGAAARVIDTQPALARQALTAVELTGRETLAGLRQMVNTWRADEGGPASARAERGLAPSPAQPGLADVDRLAATTTAAGLHVDVRWHGPRRLLPADVDLSAYRIIQESVTNVLRHAATTTCHVSIDHRDADLVVEITDQGRGGDAGNGTGLGLAGMRERVALLHGDFRAGPGPDGGFRVTARLPLSRCGAASRPGPRPNATR